jgi:hypothetical protein
MAAIDLSNAASGGGGGGGNLQLASGASMSSTLRAVTDTSNVASPLELSTTLVKITSTLRITTNDNPYVDAEDGSGNNRFTIGRDGSSQQVNVDFASNPTGSTTIVGAVRTYRDGTNLSEVMSFREDGNVGIGTTNPFSLLTVGGQSSFYSVQSAGTSPDFFYSDINPILTAGANNQVVSLARLRDRGVFNTGGFTGTQRLSLIMENEAGGQFPFQLFSETGALRIGFSTVATPTAKLEIKGSGSTSATTSFLVQNSAGTTLLNAKDNGTTELRTLEGITNLAIFDFEGWYPTVNNKSVNLYGDGGASSAIRVTGSTYSSGASQIQIKGATSISSGVNQPDASAQLDVASTTKGFLPPRMTNAQKNAIASPAEGLIVHDTTNNGVAYYDGTTWGYLSGAKQTLTGSGGTLNIGFRNGNIVDLALNASTTLTFASHVVGTYIIQVTQGGTGSYTLTYPASVKWSGGTAPTLTTTVGKTDILTFYHDGTSFFGTYSLNY